MRQALAERLVAMAEAQFAAQAPLASLIEADKRFADWVQQSTLPLLQSWNDGDPPGPLVALWRLTDAHDEELHELVSKVGWPGRSLVGEDGADAAWVVAQHADRHQPYRREWLPHVRRAVAEGEADPRHVARLTDRVALVDGEPQSYGTYAHRGATGEAEFEIPIAGSLDDLDRRRAAIGLPALAADLMEPTGSAPYRYMRNGRGYAWPPR